METIGERIRRLRTHRGWSLARLGAEMAARVGRVKPFSGEVIRLYEEGTNKPGKDARRALALVFDKSEQFIEFGAAGNTAAEPAADYVVSPAAVEIARAFDQLTPECQEHVRRQIELLGASVADDSGRRRAKQQDVRIRSDRLLTPGQKNRRKGVR